MGDAGAVAALVVALISIVTAIIAVPRMIESAIEKKVTDRLQHYYTKLEVEKQFVTAFHHAETVEDTRDELRHQRRLLVVVARKLNVPDAQIDGTDVG